jgi:hypothetical protein
MNTRRWFLLALISSLVPCAFAAEPPAFRSHDDWFQPYEPSTIGVTKDSDDLGFMDVSLSLQLPLLELGGPLPGRGQALAIAFTGRFGFYVGDRRSSRPVIGKRLNPALLWRMQLSDDAARRKRCGQSGAPVFRGRRSSDCAEYGPDSYLELAYAHESNGQAIDTEAEYLAARQASQLEPGATDYTDDRLSRGWDYVGVIYKPPTCSVCESERYKISGYAKLRYFLAHGFMQGAKEQWHSWEAAAAEGKPRSKINGLAIQGKYLRHTCVADGYACANRFVGDLKFSLGYETGYRDPFRYGTLRVEAGVYFKPLPLTLWWQRGYGADLAQYYKKTTSFGIAVDIGSF